MEHKPIKKFIVGHKYIYLKTTAPVKEDYTPDVFEKYGWNDEGEMKFALRPQIFTCSSVEKKNNVPWKGRRWHIRAIPASFAEDKSGTVWDWRLGIENWVDVTNMSEEETERLSAPKRMAYLAEKIADE